MAFQQLPPDLRRLIFENVGHYKDRACWRLTNHEMSLDHVSYDINMAQLQTIWKPFEELSIDMWHTFLQIMFGPEDFQVIVARDWGVSWIRPYEPLTYTVQYWKRGKGVPT